MQFLFPFRELESIYQNEIKWLHAAGPYTANTALSLSLCRCLYLSIQVAFFASQINICVLCMQRKEDTGSQTGSWDPPQKGHKYSHCGSILKNKMHCPLMNQYRTRFVLLMHTPRFHMLENQKSGRERHPE